jgi:hypothetical protein
MLLYPASSEAAHIASQGCAMSARYFSAMRTINCLTSRQGFDGVASENLVHLTRGRQRAHRQLQLGQQRFGAPEIRGFQAFGVCTSCRASAPRPWCCQRRADHSQCAAPRSALGEPHGCQPTGLSNASCSDSEKSGPERTTHARSFVRCLCTLDCNKKVNHEMPAERFSRTF